MMHACFQKLQYIHLRSHFIFGIWILDLACVPLVGCSKNKCGSRRFEIESCALCRAHRMGALDIVVCWISSFLARCCGITLPTRRRAGILHPKDAMGFHRVEAPGGVSTFCSCTVPLVIRVQEKKITVDALARLGNIKGFIDTKIKIHPDRQVLMCKGKELKDCRIFSDTSCKMGTPSCVFYFRRPCPRNDELKDGTGSCAA